MRASRLNTVLTLILASWVMSGCAIYSEKRDKQGKEAIDAWAKVDLKEQVSVPRKHLLALLDEQLALEDELWKARGQELARAMAYSWTANTFSSEIGKEIVRVNGSDAESTHLMNELERIRVARDSLARIALDASMAGQTLPSCEKLLDPEQRKAIDAKAEKVTPEPKKVALIASISSAVPKCREISLALGNVRYSGEMQNAKAALDLDTKALEADTKNTASARAEYKEALAEYDKAAADLTADPSTAAHDKVDQALAKLASLTKKFENINDAFSNKFVSEERLKSLNRFLSTYSDVMAGKGSPEDASKVAVALAVFPDLIDKAKVSLKDLQKPNLVPLVLQKNIEQSRLEAAEREIAVRTKLIELRNAHVKALTAELDAYQKANTALTADVLTTYGGTELVEALIPVDSSKDKVSFERKQKMWKAAALFLDAETRLRADVSKTRYRITALEHEKALTYAEANINQWKALVDPTVELVGAYGASGVKSSDIIALLNSLTLLWIGAGVN